MKCPICNDAGHTINGGTVILCPNNCDGGQKQFNVRRMMSGETADDILGLKPAGQSIVESWTEGSRTVLREDNK